jgi:hypothetical protein
MGPELKQGLGRYENIALRAEGEKMQILGPGFENDEERLLAEKVLSRRKMDFRIEDPLALERKMQVSEAFKTLNNAEKNCYANGYGAIIYRDGAYYFMVNAQVYKEYVKKFGTECLTCEKIKAGQVGSR